MKQLTKKQALVVFHGGEWKDWTDEDIVRFQLYQERTCMPFNVFHRAVINVFGRQVFTHEFANSERLIDEYEGKCPAPTFEEIINMIPDETKIIIEMDDEE